MKSGFVSFLGRPNAGKSTLLNQILGRKVSIVSDKPQTTRNRILAVKNYPDAQVVFLDTPGIHRPLHRMNVRMLDRAIETISEVDVLAVVIDCLDQPGAGTKYLFGLLKKASAPVVLVLNKIDSIPEPQLLPMMEQYSSEFGFADIVPVSALTGDNVLHLEEVFIQHLPIGDAMYPDDYVTDQPERVFIAETIREKVLMHTRDELPFATVVTIDRIEDNEADGIMRLYCSILVDRDSQKAIVIGKRGAMIKRIGTDARLDLERLFDTRVFLDLHVKVSPEWRDNERLLDELGLSR
jgi:GTP-binding protein Era